MPQLLIGLAFMGYMGYLANKKGYMWFAWFLAAGLIGLLVLFALPDITKLPETTTPEEKAKKIQTGNIIGGVISGVAILAIIAVVALSR